MSPPRGLHLKSPETAVRKHTGKGCNVSTALVAAARRCIPRAVVVADPEDGEGWTCLPKVRATDAHADWCIANGIPALLALCRGNSAACLRVAVGRCHQSPLPDSSPLVQHLRGGGWCDGGCAARCKGPGDQPTAWPRDSESHRVQEPCARTGDGQLALSHALRRSDRCKFADSTACAMPVRRPARPSLFLGKDPDL